MVVDVKGNFGVTLKFVY